MPTDFFTDANALYHVLRAARAPAPADEGSRLWLTWLQDGVDRGSIRCTGWCSTVDQLGDGLTQAGVDPTAIYRLMNDGKLYVIYSQLVNGVIANADKGSPPPKSGKDPAAVKFPELSHSSTQLLETFVRSLEGDR